MSIVKTIGGDRVGSGKKMQAHLHNYFRSTHNLSEKFASSLGPGILYPAMCKLGMRGDSFDIDVQADIRTIPTKGPLFGSYKMQIDVYQCPIRLYQAILHNNPLAIGLKMTDVKFPLLGLTCFQQFDEDDKTGEINKSALIKYLGMSGLGRSHYSREDEPSIQRYINAIPALAYYDIFKTYYANKQEEKAYVITPSEIEKENALYKVTGDNGEIEVFNYEPYNNEIVYFVNSQLNIFLKINNGDLDPTKITINGSQNSDTLANLVTNGYLSYIENPIPNNKTQVTILKVNSDFDEDYGTGFSIESEIYTDNYISKPKLTPFDLSNIDDMRYDILSHHTLGIPFKIDSAHHNYYPYKSLVDTLETGLNINGFPLNGLVIKTYQNDIFNNWLNTEWIEGENGISEMTKVSVTNGEFSMDALNFAQKLYNMLNRIAIAGATYEDWQDVVYEEVKRRQIESPIFVGGMSQELMFDEVIQTAPAEGDPLGTLGGRGRNIKQSQKGGKMHIKCDEACFIIAIVSLTPRIFYTQGNEFYLTDVLSMDDLHKPAMDGIGFQDLIGERLAWWDTALELDGTETRTKIGKLPAWIEYMTSYDRAYGDFAEEYGKGYMVLNRNYERDPDTGGILDATTYIDPAKYNYVFAYSDLTAQNFWCEIAFNIKARRLMSARLIPNV